MSANPWDPASACLFDFPILHRVLPFYKMAVFEAFRKWFSTYGLSSPSELLKLLFKRRTNLLFIVKLLGNGGHLVLWEVKDLWLGLVYAPIVYKFLISFKAWWCFDSLVQFYSCLKFDSNLHGFVLGIGSCHLGINIVEPCQICRLDEQSFNNFLLHVYLEGNQSAMAYDLALQWGYVKKK